MITSIGDGKHLHLPLQVLYPSVALSKLLCELLFDRRDQSLYDGLVQAWGCAVTMSEHTVPLSQLTVPRSLTRHPTVPTRSVVWFLFSVAGVSLSTFSLYPCAVSIGSCNMQQVCSNTTIYVYFNFHTISSPI